MSMLLLGMVLSVFTCWFHNMVTLPASLVSTNFGTTLSNITPISVHKLKCSSAPTPSCLFMYHSFAAIEHADMMWPAVSSNCWHSLHLLSVSIIFLFHDILFVMPDLVLLLFHFKLLLSYLPLTAIQMFLH